MIKNNVEMSILINSHNAREYSSPMDLQTYIEGREGSEFTIRLTNRNSFRVLAIPSVDGLSILDGKPAGSNSSGYILEANQVLDIPGWKVDNATAAKFFFSGMKNNTDESYVAQSGNDTANKGVIGLMVFNEKPQYQNMMKGIVSAPMGVANPMRSFGIASSTLMCSNSITASSATPTMDSALDHDAALGTGFGQATDFSTTKSTFERNDLLCLMVMYYKDARGLKKVGIDVAKPIARPSAFPADNGCAPPSGWAR